MRLRGGRIGQHAHPICLRMRHSARTSGAQRFIIYSSGVHRLHPQSAGGELNGFDVSASTQGEEKLRGGAFSRYQPQHDPCKGSHATLCHS